MTLRKLPLPRLVSSRSYATQSSGSGMPAIFDRRVKQIQRTRSVVDAEANREADYLKDEVARRMVDRLAFIKRDLGHVVDLGGGNGHIARALTAARAATGTDTTATTGEGGGETTTTTTSQAPRIERLTVTDLSMPLAERDDARTAYPGLTTSTTGESVTRRFVDEESLPFEPGTLDAILSSLALHWVNDLPGCLIQIRRSLVPDGVFLGAMFGGDTLFELRTALQLAEMDRLGGIGPRTSPMTDVKDVGSLLNRAGFKLTTIDVEDVVVDYPDIFALMADLGRMGEGNAVLARPGGPLGRDTLMAAQAIYRDMHGNADGTLPATFSVLFMIGWAPAPTTPRPQARGSGEASLKETLEQFRDPNDASRKEKKKKKKPEEGGVTSGGKSE